MTHRESPDPRPPRPGSGDTRLEAIERLRRQLDKLAAQGRGTGSGAFDTAPYGGREYDRTPRPRAESDGSDSKTARTQRRSTRGTRRASTDEHDASTDERRSTGEGRSAGESRSWGRRREEAPPAPSDSDEQFDTDADESFESDAVQRLGDILARSTNLARPQADSDGESDSHARGRGTWDWDSDTELDDSSDRQSRRGSSGRRTAGDEESSSAGEEEFDAGERGSATRRRGAATGRRGAADGADGAEVSVGEDSGDESEDASDRRGRGGRRGGRGRRRSGADDSDGGLPGGGTEAQAKDVCLRLLGDRARSRSELADRLATRGFSVEIANKALDRLTEVGLIDDAAFAEQWVHQRHTFSGKGKRALVQELRRKGVADEDAEPALAAISDDDEYERAAELVRRKLRTLPRDLDREKVLRRLVGMLARRGYNQSTAFTVVKAELADMDLTEPDSR